MFKAAAIYYLISALSTVRASYIERDVIIGDDTSISIIGLTVHNEMKLDVATLSNHTTSNTDECLKKCSSDAECVSLNYGKSIPPPNCFLLSTNLYLNKEEFIYDAGMIHFSIKNTGCDSMQCLNNATCIPNYTNDSFTCNCTEMFDGQWCQNEIKDPDPSIVFNFDEDATNTGTKPLDCTLTLNGGKRVHLADRVGKVLYCDHVTTCSTNAVNTIPGWIDPKSVDLTISMWVKLRPFQPSTSLFLTHILSVYDAGFGIHYNFDMSRWEFVAFSITEVLQLVSVINVDPKTAFYWHHLVLVNEKTTMQGYVDGVKKHATETTAPVTNSPRRNDFFSDNTKSPFFVDDMKVWYHALNDNDIIGLYNKD